MFSTPPRPAPGGPGGPAAGSAEKRPARGEKPLHGPLHELFRKAKGTKLLEAASTGDMVVLRVELAKGKDLEARNDVDWTPLFCAAFYGHMEAARELLSQGADSDSTPLISAVDKGHMDLARMLVEAGADVNASSKTGWTALACAANRGDTAMAQYLLLRGAVRRELGVGYRLVSPGK